MDKELEELKNIVAIHFGALGFLNPSENEQILKDRDKVLNALTELQAIKEAKPSEAIKALDRNIVVIREKDYTIIEQALLKAQKLEKKLDKYNELNKTFSDNHICEIIKEFAKYEHLCEESKCDECALAIGDAICLKAIFENKWEVQKKNWELQKEKQELEKYKKTCDIIKEKNVDIEYIKTCFYDEKGGLKEYNAYVGHDEERELTQEEFDLLKEMTK